jgi:peptide deformylase
MAKNVKYYKGDLVEYEILKLVDFYDPILREPTVPVKFDTPEDLKNNEFLAFSMAETLQQLGGLGLSANQVGRKERMCVINIGKEIWTMFNPVIVDKSMVPTEFQEGCLSYPGLYLKIGRPDYIKVRFQAVAGQFVEKEVNGLTAVCIQHEIDHLDGVVYTDLVSPIKLEQAKRKVKSNLKKMRKISEQQYKEALLEQKQTTTSKSEIPLPKLEISNLEQNKTEKAPEKFVYNMG